jgi:hypothetical protein
MDDLWLLVSVDTSERTQTWTMVSGELPVAELLRRSKQLGYDRAPSVILIPPDCWLYSLFVDCSQRNGQRP